MIWGLVVLVPLAWVIFVNRRPVMPPKECEEETCKHREWNGVAKVKVGCPWGKDRSFEQIWFMDTEQNRNARRRTKR